MEPPSAFLSRWGFCSWLLLQRLLKQRLQEALRRSKKLRRRALQIAAAEEFSKAYWSLKCDLPKIFALLEGTIFGTTRLFLHTFVMKLNIF